MTITRQQSVSVQTISAFKAVCVLILAVIVTALNSSVVLADPNSAPPNIVVILVDDLGWTSTSVQMDPDEPDSKSDYHHTPNLERLANEGMRFSNAYSASPMCSPSRAAVFTGKSPAQLSQTDVIVAMDPTSQHFHLNYVNEVVMPPIPMPFLDERVTYAEHLAEHAPEYHKALLRKDHVASNPWRYGFDLFDHGMAGFEVEGEDPTKLFSTANRANQYMEERVQEGRPFMLEIAPFAVHLPYEYTTDTYNEVLARPIGTRHNDPKLAAMVQDLDTSIGMVLDKIDELGIEDNTYVIFTSDNGGHYLPATLNDPLLSSKGSIWEGGIRVPTIARGPGITANSVSDVPVIGTDLFATISELAGVTAPADPTLESASWVPLFENGGQLPEGTKLQRGVGKDGELFFHTPYDTGLSSFSSAVRHGDFKLVKLYGFNGDPDELLLFDLSANIIESDDPNSSLNLASTMPAKRDELHAKLQNWLEAVEAPMPMNVLDDVRLHWRADSVDDYPSLWRSTNRVQDLRRESWDIVPDHRLATPPPSNEFATHVDTAPHQPGLGKKAYAFDGNDRMEKPAFLVSLEHAPTQAGENSVSWEFWLKLGDMDPNNEKILLETGDETAGISLTFGDADSDGKSNDLRFRVVGRFEDPVTATVPVDSFADPLNDFIHATAVLSDVDTDRYLAIYINGALALKLDGIDGIGWRLDWDDYGDATLGNVGDTYGSNTGSGDLPFSGGLVGEVSEMAFYNYAISDADVLANYNAMLYPADFGIHSVAGQASIPSERPSNASLNSIESSALMVVQERNDVTDAALAVDATVTGGTIDFNPGTLPVGTELTSYLLQFDPSSNDGGIEESVVGSIQFSQEIIAIMFDSASLAATDGSLGALGDYGLEADRGLVLDINDILSVSPDGKTLSFDLDIAGDELLQFRVITEQALLGDFDLDGDVDSLDLDVWEAAYGTNDAGDIDFDGDTDGADFLAWQRRMSALASTTTVATQTVPEPNTILLVALASVAVGGRCSRKRSVA